jgi:hypothetical protein
LYFGLRLNNPYFANFTQPVIADSVLKPIYANAATPRTLAPPTGVLPVAGWYSHPLKNTARPVVLRLFDASAQLVADLTATGEDTDAALDLRALPHGVYTLTEDYGGGLTHDSALLLDAELRDSAIWGVLAIKVDASFYDPLPLGGPAAFSLSFLARTEVLQYYVVANNYTPAQFTHLFAQLSVVDAGSVDEGRPAVLFDKFDKAAVDAATPGLSSSLLTGSGADMLLFQSEAEVARREQGLGSIHLQRNGDMLVKHLPQPGADRSRAQFIIHLSKP